MREKTDTIRLFGLVGDSIVDGPGFRVSIFTQGCPHHCPGCHNPGSHDFEAGTVWTLDDVEKKFTGNPLLSGITLSGGEPFAQAAACAELARRAHQKGLNVWVYSGYTYEKLLEKAQAEEGVDALLKDCLLYTSDAADGGGRAGGRAVSAGGKVAGAGFSRQPESAPD